MPDPGDPKARLRALLLDRRDALGDDRRAVASAGICERLLKVPEVAGARVVAAFSPVGSEVDVRPALEDLLALGRTVLLPRVVGRDLELAAVGDLALDLVPGWRGVREPHRGAAPVPPRSVDVFITPGLGFDGRGTRLGYGGGHYDRLLDDRHPDAAVVGVAFSVQVLGAIPALPHDVPVDRVVTEEAVLATTARPPRSGGAPRLPNP